jgi:hypothetical protein
MLEQGSVSRARLMRRPRRRSARPSAGTELAFDASRRHEGRGKLIAKEKTEGYELRLERLLDAPRANVWRWRTEVKTLEPRPGGASHIVMRGPDGEERDGVGVFLEAVPEQRLVFTNTFTPGWIPAAQPAIVPFMTTIVEMSDEGGKSAMSCAPCTGPRRRGSNMRRWASMKAGDIRPASSKPSPGRSEPALKRFGELRRQAQRKPVEITRVFEQRAALFDYALKQGRALLGRGR